ncbi:hypothetical protein F2Q69_00058553 [Brassica cretica]|uniref:Uncharacterized protein n=1 Tax=Brassica cretica TaxID=69181 RepID=A0A8S9RCG0_BRACR|nr:hypothetical protein F2Q69_00058553 [Brassica cretica]
MLLVRSLCRTAAAASVATLRSLRSAPPNQLLRNRSLLTGGFFAVSSFPSNRTPYAGQGSLDSAPMVEKLSGYLPLALSTLWSLYDYPPARYPVALFGIIVAGWEAGSMRWMGDGSILSVRKKTRWKDGEDGRLVVPFNPI